jgi:diguanylate cyclase (GGDEF)-like protein/PAS domain S-box-containing protein
MGGQTQDLEEQADLAELTQRVQGLASAEHDELLRFRLLADSVPALIAYYQREGLICLWANRQYAQTFGQNTQSIVGRTLPDIVGEEAAQLILPHVDVVLNEKRTVGYERQLKTADGQPRWISVSLVPHGSPGGDIIGAFVLISDITRHHLAEAALREGEERLSKFMQASLEGIFFHRDGVITDANSALLNLLGTGLEGVVGRNLLDFVAPAWRARVREVMLAGQDVNYELEVLGADGRGLPVEVLGRSITRRGETLRLVVVRDIRDRLAAQARIHHLAHHDALTGLPNRLAFMQQLEHALYAAQAARPPHMLALLFVDLDHFKRVNDSLGHLAGDSLLKTVAERLQGALRPGDLVGRFGGDEFMVMLPRVAGRHAVEEVAQRLLQAVEVPVRVGGQAVSVTPSIGVAMYPQDAAVSEELVKHADTAMYVAKSQGRAACRFFEPDMAAHAYAAIVLEGEIARALERGELQLLLQPLQCLEAGQRPGRLAVRHAAQAQLRWHHPRRGLLAPQAFSEVALERRLLQPMAEWALAEALRLAQRWRDKGLPALSLSVDLSALPLSMGAVVEAVQAALASHAAHVLGHGEVVPAGLVLDLSEATLAEGLGECRAHLVRLADLGVWVHIADFGGGVLPLNQLPALPVHGVRLGPALVRGLPQDPATAAVAGAVAQMARSLGLGLVAEGVHAPEQRQWLQSLGAFGLQGPLVAPAMTAETFELWLGQQA